MQENQSQTPVNSVNPEASADSSQAPVTPVPPVQKKSRKGLLLAITALLVIGATGAISLLVAKKDITTSTTSTTEVVANKQLTEAEQEANLLSKIKADGEVLMPVDDVISQKNYADNFGYYLANDQYVQVSPADIYLDYNKNVKSNIESLHSILKNNGLNEETGAIKDSNRYQFSNDKAACNIAYTGDNWVRLYCVSATKFQYAKNNVKVIIDGVGKHLGAAITSDVYSINYLKSSDGTVNGAVYSGNRGASDPNMIYDYYMVLKDGEWVYVSRSYMTSMTTKDTLLIDCSLLGSAEYKDVFRDYTLVPANCKK